MIKYLIGDATNPISVNGPKLLIHISNDKRKWGAGFVLALSKKWKAPQQRYLEDEYCRLGQIQMVQVEPYLYVINMIAQTLSWKDGNPPIRYEALEDCLWQVAIIANAMNAVVVAPRFGAGLAGGDWNKIESIINDQLVTIPVFIYDLPGT